jgi:ketosteroid isomerase-like protein
VGLPAIRERWVGFLSDQEWTASDGTVKELGGSGDEAWAWLEFTNHYRLRGQARVQHGNQLEILRKQPDGTWKIHRVTWQSIATADTASAASK